MSAPATTVVATAIRDLARRPRRIVLGIAGAALGSLVYVVLVGVGDGLVRQIRTTSNLTGAELVVQQAGAGFPDLSWIERGEVDAVRALEGVDDTLEVAIRTTRFGPSRYLLVLGIGPEIPQLPGIELLAGRLPAAGNDEILLGDGAAAMLGVTAGDPIRLHRRELVVAGVITSGRSLLDRGAVLPLDVHQELFAVGDRCNLVFVHLADGAARATVAARLERWLPGLEAVPTDGLTSHYGQVDVIGQFARVLGLAATAITLLWVSNVLLAAVADRLPELAVLRAVGWTRSRIAALVLLEGLAVAVTGAAAGAVLAFAALPLLAAGASPLAVDGPHLGTCLEALAVVAAAGLLGAAPAAVLAVRARPAELLRAA